MNPRVRMEIIEIEDGRVTAAIEERLLEDGTVASAILKDAKFAETGHVLTDHQMQQVRNKLGCE